MAQLAMEAMSAIGLGRAEPRILFAGSETAIMIEICLLAPFDINRVLASARASGIFARLILGFTDGLSGSSSGSPNPQASSSVTDLTKQLTGHKSSQIRIR